MGAAVDRQGTDKAAARHRRQFMRNLAVRLVSLTIVLTLWQVLGARAEPVLFTTPIAIFHAAVEMIGNGELWTYLAPSLAVLAVGLTLAVVVGVAVGLLLARYWLLDVGLGVYITFLYSIPGVALVPLIVLWTGFGLFSKVVILFVFAFFPMAINTYQGVKNVDPNLIEVGRAFRSSERQLWTDVILPGALPFIVAGLRLAVGRGLIGMVLADLYTAISGIGYLIVQTATTFQIDKMFVPIVTLGLLGVTLTAGVRFVETRVAPWSRANDQD
jgi:NitT/TauT family transport system permease protein